MAVEPTDIKIYLTGGAANTDPDKSLGAARSATAYITDEAAKNNLFDDISDAERQGGIIVEYRIVDFVNINTVGSVYLVINKATTQPGNGVTYDFAFTTDTTSFLVDERDSTGKIGTFTGGAGVGGALLFSDTAVGPDELPPKPPGSPGFGARFVVRRTKQANIGSFLLSGEVLEFHYDLTTG